MIEARGRHSQALRLDHGHEASPSDDHNHEGLARVDDLDIGASLVVPAWEQIIVQHAGAAASLTHQLFQFPAKTYPPAARAMVHRYSRPGDVIGDPFVGSGTIALEALVAGRQVVASDVDPLAVFITRSKITPLDPTELRNGFDLVLGNIARYRRTRQELLDLQHRDLDDQDFASASYELTIPAIPNRDHWFRRHVLVDLARLRSAILTAPLNPSVRRYLLACFASSIRLSSNADPVPVSGLEVTAYMRERDARGRTIDPFAIFARRASIALRGMDEYWRTVPKPARARAFVADATRTDSRYPTLDAIITSPPYHGAVDYYRRHTLEMYWLDLTQDHAQRLTLKRRYLGRARVAQTERFTRRPLTAELARDTEATIRVSDAKRADAFRHYCSGMQRFFDRAAGVVKPDGWLVLVVGHSSWNGSELDTSGLLAQLARPSFVLAESGTYAVANRHMSYSRRNGANIDRESVIAFRRTRGG